MMKRNLPLSKTHRHLSYSDSRFGKSVFLICHAISTKCLGHLDVSHYIAAIPEVAAVDYDRRPHIVVPIVKRYRCGQHPFRRTATPICTVRVPSDPDLAVTSRWF